MLAKKGRSAILRHLTAGYSMLLVAFEQLVHNLSLVGARFFLR